MVKLTNAAKRWGTALGKLHFRKGQHQIGRFIVLTRDSNVGKNCSVIITLKCLPSYIGAN